MRILLGFLLVCWFSPCPAQRILYTSQELNRTDTTQAIMTIRPNWVFGNVSNNITVIYRNGAQQKISRDSIWGFEDRNHSVYRSYLGNLYRMEQADDLLAYTCGTCRHAYVRYSKRLDSPMYWTRRKARKDTITDK